MNCGANSFTAIRDIVRVIKSRMLALFGSKHSRNTEMFCTARFVAFIVSEMTPDSEPIIKNGGKFGE